MIIKNNLVVVFDLDDTLYHEIDFLKSAYKEIAQYLASTCNSLYPLIYSDMVCLYDKGLNVFEGILEMHRIKDVEIKGLLNIYRQHKPDISLSNSIQKLLENLKRDVFKMGLITDGRSIQQRNKISALGLSSYFDAVIISEEFGSEKPHINNFKYFVDAYGTSKQYIYVGDNTRKDFIAPNKLGWHTVCLLDNGKNIHKQSFSKKDTFEAPHYIIKDLVEIEGLIKQLI
ncbi:HAD family hydrolase [Mariniflexile litorale]|uniref:HAD family hydrolase n=1 Tax=Mariniflexile litorale TaxID=3045158 RepID=A0AAU7ECV5_9FLAO|nr:HAD family hydrolase [Mariniflexile sp. KMM 9835]MDQ8211529.1 HAD family hydrolase [Mariniflexile sp. KMM 9835]